MKRLPIAMLLGAILAASPLSSGTSLADGNLQFAVHAKGSGKIIIVKDRVTGMEVLHQFVGPDAVVQVNVASPDGQSGDIDVSAQMTADSPLTVVEQDYQVRSGEQIDVEDI